MTKEEILEMSRAENKNQDERERDALAKAGRRASAVGGIVCAVIIILELIFTQQCSVGIWAVYLSITGTTLLVKYLHLKKKHELIFGIVQLVLAAAFLTLHIIRLVGTVR